jgi:hypothetical protein
MLPLSSTTRALPPSTIGASPSPLPEELAFHGVEVLKTPVLQIIMVAAGGAFS